MQIQRAVQFALLLAVASQLHAQVLNETNPVGRLSDVTQFGVPRDAKFVLCSGEDCPDRSIKHFSEPPRAAKERPAQIIPPAPAAAQPVTTELSRAKVQDPPPKAVIDKPVRHKRRHKKQVLPKVTCKSE